MGKRNAIYRHLTKGKKPVIGVFARSFQGTAIRHGYMRALVDLLAQENKKKSISVLEIGSWAGSSAITWGSAIQEYFEGQGKVICIDPWSDYLDLNANKSSVYAEMSEELKTGQVHELFLHNIKTSGLSDMVMEFRGKSEDALPFLKGKSFDIVYIDGDHSLQAVRSDIKLGKQLVAENGFICGDDLEAQLDDTNTEITIKLADNDVDCALDEKTGESIHPGVTVAVSQEFGRVSEWHGFWAMRRRKSAFKPVDLSGFEIIIPPHLEELSDLSAESTMPTYRGTYCDYSIVHWNDVFVAVRNDVGDISLFDESVGERELEPKILRGKSEDEIHARIDKYSVPNEIEAQSKRLEGEIKSLKKVYDELRNAFDHQAASVKDSERINLAYFELCRKFDAISHENTSMDKVYAELSDAFDHQVKFIDNLKKEYSHLENTYVELRDAFDHQVECIKDSQDAYTNLEKAHVELNGSYDTQIEENKKLAEDNKNLAELRDAFDHQAECIKDSQDAYTNLEKAHVELNDEFSDLEKTYSEQLGQRIKRWINSQIKR